MALFGKGKPTPIFNEVPTGVDKPSLTNGNAYVDGEILSKMPFGKNEVIRLNDTWQDREHDKTDVPNIFSSWSDVYESFIGTYQMTTAPDGLKDHETLILHYLFLFDSFALYRVDDDNWLVGNASVIKSDNYGNILDGQFVPWNYATLKPSADEDTFININSSNNSNFINHQMSPYKIPLFLKIGFYINVRKILWMFKKTNLRLSVLQKVIGIEADGRDAMVKFLQELFNQNDDFISPIQVVDITSNHKEGKERKYTINFTDLSKDNQIDLSFDYRGVEINDDLEGVTREIFRVAGLRTDLQASMNSYSERNTTDQVQQASNYFDTRENFVLKSFEKFSRNFKKKFGVEVKWESIYNLSQQGQGGNENGEVQKGSEVPS